MAIRYRSEGFYLSFHLYLSVNVALVNEHALFSIILVAAKSEPG